MQAALCPLPSTAWGMLALACDPIQGIRVILTYIASLRLAWSEILSQKQQTLTFQPFLLHFLKGFKHL